MEWVVEGWEAGESDQSLLARLRLLKQVTDSARQRGARHTMCHQLRRAGSPSTAVEFSEGRVNRSIEPPLQKSGQPCGDVLEAGNKRMNDDWTWKEGDADA